MKLNFQLRDDIKWHDEKQITASDVKWSIEYALKISAINPIFATTFNAIVGANDYVAGKVDEIKGISVDGQKLDIEFETFTPNALIAFTQFSPLPKVYFENEDPVNFQKSSFWNKPIGSGPFMVDEVNFNEYTTLIPFDKYFDNIPDFGIYLTPSPGDSDANLVANAQAGMVDYAYTKNIDDALTIKSIEGFNVEQVDIRYTRLFYVNKFDKQDGSKSPLANINVRQAIAYAIDMDSLAKDLFKGSAIPANSLTPNESNKISGLNDYKYNPQKAKQLLAAANWNPDYILDVVYYYTDQQTVDYLSAVKKYLREVGIKMDFRLLEGDLSTLLWKTPADPIKGPSAINWDMAYAAIAAQTLNEYYDRYQTGFSTNSHTPKNVELDTLIRAISSTFDNDKILEAFHALQKYENETLFSIPLYYQPIYIIESDKILTGSPKYGNPQFNYNWDIVNWKLLSD